MVTDLQTDRATTRGPIGPKNMFTVKVKLKIERSFSFVSIFLTSVRPPEPGDAEADSLAAQLPPHTDPLILQHLEAVSRDDLPVLGPRDHAVIWN